MVEDEVASTDIRSRRHFGARIKDFTVNVVQSCHAKNRQAISLKPFWRLTVSLNEEPENLLILPPFDDSLADKILLLRVFKVPLPMPTYTPEERDMFWKTLLAELPAFLWHLIQWEIPAELKCHRFGIQHFHHARLLEALDALTPESKLLGLIDVAFKQGLLDKADFVGTAEDLEMKLMANALNDYEVKRLLTWSGAAGTYLGRLASKPSPRVFKARKSELRLWRIVPPPSDDAVTPELVICPSQPPPGESPFDKP